MKKLLEEIELRDVLIGGGLLIFSIGVALIYRPAGVIAFGLGLYKLGYFGVPALADSHDVQSTTKKN
jgi:hypothetical protein